MNIEVLTTLAVVLLIAALVVLVLLWRRTGHAAAPDDAQAQLAQEREAHRLALVDAGQLRGRLETLLAELEGERGRGLQQAQVVTSLTGRIERETALAAGRDARLAERESLLLQAQQALAQARQELQQEQQRYQQLHGEHARAVANLQHSERASAELRVYLDTAREKLSGAFAELAGKVFDERGQQFEKNVRDATVQSRADIEVLLKPFADKLGDFRTRVDTLYGEEARQRASLLGAVGELKTLNQDMAAQAAALTNALKGSAKVRGDWGELMLDNVLRGSGLEEGVHYQRQKHAVDDDGARLRPDVVVRFPDDRSVVIDSKVNLIAWQEAMNATTPEVAEDALRRHAVALRQHVKDLGDKNYPKALGSDTLDITIAFVPIEGALSAALGADGALQSYAFDNRVVFASPNTLMALLRVAERLWTRDKVQKQALKISEAGGLVLDALTGFLQEFNAMGRKLEDAGKAYGEARNRLLDSPQSAINRARRLAELGSKGKRALPPELAPDPLQQLAAQEGEEDRG
ncbi:DNA recombination protein RmuC [Stenotrophomonas sp. 24(2023)]|uniref:DNA recombination protein RmuC n=1 Tax=Stenotrophomonas sp. 24(2023) TaxID=3068324 RepID=UPI0027E14362|nr:DNA recombination protein RmuC [Stenotrophomonas sp. 24(2023)]WMJ71069.1 DNA recombination protein RmuC [Stenotrophomonas sp. 24(2023)]